MTNYKTLQDKDIKVIIEEVFIRDITADEIGAITELIKELGYSSDINNVSKRLLKISSNECYKTVVAKINKKVVGFIGMCKLYAYEYDGEYVRIVSLVVNEQYRGNGIGRKLMEFGEKWAKDEGAIAVALNSGINRKEAHEFYKKNGYNIKGYSFSKKLN